MACTESTKVSKACFQLENYREMLLVKNNASLWSFYLRQLHPQQKPKYVQRVGTKVVKTFGAIILLWRWIQPAGQVWQPKLTAAQLWMSSLLCSAWKKSPLVPSAGFPVCLYLQGSTSSGGKICTSVWLSGFVTECQGQSTQSSTQLHPATQGMSWWQEPHWAVWPYTPGPMDGD